MRSKKQIKQEIKDYKRWFKQEENIIIKLAHYKKLKELHWELEKMGLSKREQQRELPAWYNIARKFEDEYLVNLIEGRR